MSGPQFIYVMKDLRKVVPPKREILKGIWLSFFPGAKIRVVGPNGAGKSTLLRIMAGVDHDFQGEAWPARGTRVSYLPQEPRLDTSMNVRGNVEEGVKETRALLARFDEVNLAFGEVTSDEEMQALLEEQARLHDRIDATGAWDLDRKIGIAMDVLRLPPSDVEIETLSGGERRRVALCKVLLEEPDLLLLDEPTNHLDAESVAWLERHLADFKGTIVAVTHDRYFLDNVAEWILELDRGEGHPFHGNYSSWLEQKSARLAQEEKQASARRKTLERELEWIRMSPRARQAKGKARITAYEEMLAQGEEEKVAGAEILIPRPPRLGNDVVIFEGVTKAFGDNVLMENVSFRLPRGGIVGIIGPNGAGKTTTFRMIVGTESPDEGTMTVGSTVRLAHVDQSRADLLPDHTVWEEVSGGHEVVDFGWAEVNSRAYLSWFNFRGAEQQKKVGVLSGGERNRLHLAKLLKSGGNVLLLDEPTNDLDVDTLRALEDALLSFPGLRRGDLPRPLVPGSDRDPHPGIRGRLHRLLVRGELSGLRGGPRPTPWGGGGAAAPDPVQTADTLVSRSASVPADPLTLTRDARVVLIPVSHGHLEANLRPADPPVRGAAVLCHAHPQHGGTMHTKAVYRAAQALSDVGFHVLRFNFRGVGASTGTYGGGTGEEEDAWVGLDWIQEAHPSLPTLVGGFSFGSRVGLRVGLRDPRVAGLVGLGIPVSLDDFSFLSGTTKPILVVQGEQDEYGSGDDVQQLVDGIPGSVTLVRIADSDHYFDGHFEELQAAVREYFRHGPGSSAFPAR